MISSKQIVRLIAICSSLGAAMSPASADAQIVDSSFMSNGVRIHYVESGKGSPVVLLHGIGGSLERWRVVPIFDNLARNFRVIAIDQRGHGQSGKPHETAAYGREMALDVVRLMNHLGITKANVVGYSLGATVTSQLLTMHPERVRAAVLISGGARLSWSAAEEARANAEAREREELCISPTLLAAIRPPGQPALTPERLRELSAACMADTTQDRFAVAALTRSRKDQVMNRADAAAVKVPTLAIVGSLEPGKADMEALIALRPSIEFVVVDGASHAGERGILTRAETLAALRTFLTRQN